MNLKSVNLEVMNSKAMNLKTVLYVLLLSLSFFFFPSSSARAAVQNPFANADFENGGTGGWIVENPYKKPLAWGATSDTASVHSGKWAGALTGFGDDTTQSLNIYNQVNVSALPAGTLIHVKFFLKTDSLAFYKLKKGMAASLVTTDKNGHRLSASGTNGFAGSYAYTPISFFLELPPKAELLKFQFDLNCGIKSGSIYLDDLSFEVIDNLPSAPQPGTVDCRVQKDAAGVPRLMVNGAIEPPLFFFGNNGNGSPVIFEEMAKARKVGVRLIQVGMELPWGGSCTGVLEQVIAANPDALILPRISMYPPVWWVKEHKVSMILPEQGQLKAGKRGGLASPSSEDLNAAWKHQLELLIRFIQSTPLRSHIVGYHPTYLNTGEWFYPDSATQYTDFSVDSRAHFARWAAARYGTLEKINAAWGTSYAALDQIKIPPSKDWEQGDDGLFRDPVKRRQVIDFLTNQNDLIADRLVDLADTIKSASGGHSLAAFFYGYQNELINNAWQKGVAQTGHLALRRVLASPNVDIICSPVSYFDRQIGGPSNMMSVVDSITLAGKLCLQEADAKYMAGQSQGKLG